MMNLHTRTDLDNLLRDLTLVGFGALVAWTLVGALGTLMGLLAVQPVATLRFLAAIVLLVFARDAHRELVQWRMHKLPPEERYGFSAPVRERPRAEEQPRTFQED